MQLVETGKDIPITKQTMANFVKDMVKIEQDEFTLRKSIEDLRQKASNDIKASEQKVENLKLQLKSAVATIEDNKLSAKRYEKEMKPLPEKPVCPGFPKEIEEWADSQSYSISDPIITLKERKNVEVQKSTFGNLITSMVTSFFITMGVIFVTAIFFSIFNMASSQDHDGILITLVILELIFVPIAATLILAKFLNSSDNKRIKEYNLYEPLKALAIVYDEKRSDYYSKYNKYKKDKEYIERFNAEKRKNISYAQKYIADAEKRIPTLETEIEVATKAKDKAYVRGGLLYAQADMLQEQANIIYHNKMQLYKLGIVPPNYRTLDAMIMINSIFLNDQADTMREATLLYDERVYRGEVLKGINNIYRMLGSLAASMSAISVRLTEVRNEVRLMSTELYSISDRLCSIDRNLEINISKHGEINSTLYNIAQAQHQSNEMLSSKFDTQSYENKLLRDSLLEQTKASQYAAVSASNAAYKQNWYMEQYRQRLL